MPSTFYGGSSLTDRTGKFLTTDPAESKSTFIKELPDDKRKFDDNIPENPVSEVNILDHLIFQSLRNQRLCLPNNIHPSVLNKINEYPSHYAWVKSHRLFNERHDACTQKINIRRSKNKK
jgi:hypothetical protein